MTNITGLKFPELKLKLPDKALPLSSSSFSSFSVFQRITEGKQFESNFEEYLQIELSAFSRVYFRNKK